MVYELRHQPFKALYLTVELAVTLFVRLPTYLLVNIPKAGRPRRDWSYGRGILINFLRMGTFLSSITGRAGPLLKEPDYTALYGAKGSKGVWVPAVPHLVVGEVKTWAEQGNIKSISIPGYWYDKEGHDLPAGTPARPGEKVIYVIHGGGFVGGSASAAPPGLWSTATTRLAACHPSIQRGFAVEYRLTTGPPLEQAHPFPTALIDALAGYAYLINEIGFKAEDIIVMGDSAGGNLALALARYLVETRANDSFSGVPVPAPPLGLILLSPFGDLGDSHDGKDSSERVNLSSDYLEALDSPVFKYARSNYSAILGFPAAANTSRYLSPASIDPNAEPISFKGFPKTWLTYGDAEILYDQCRSVEKKMIGDMGEENVTVYEVKDAPHDIMLAPFWEPEYTASYQALSRWLDKLIPVPAVN